MSLCHVKCRTMCSLIKAIIVVMMSYIGPEILVILYTIMGAYLFQYIEQSKEIERCIMGEVKERMLIRRTTYRLINYIYYNSTDKFSTNRFENYNSNQAFQRDNSEVTNRTVTNMLYTLRVQLIEIQQKYKYYGQDCSKQSLWSFKSSLLFTVSLLTTVGM